MSSTQSPWYDPQPDLHDHLNLQRRYPTRDEDISYTRHEGGPSIVRDNGNAPPNQARAWRDNNPSNVYDRMGDAEQPPDNLGTRDKTLERLALMEEKMKRLLPGKDKDDCDSEDELGPFAPNIAAAHIRWALECHTCQNLMEMEIRQITSEC